MLLNLVPRRNLAFCRLGGAQRGWLQMSKVCIFCDMHVDSTGEDSQSLGLILTPAGSAPYESNERCARCARKMTNARYTRDRFEGYRVMLASARRASLCVSQRPPSQQAR